MNKLISAIFVGIGAFVAFMVLFFIISLLVAWPVMLLWNWLMPAIFGLKLISFWQSWGLLMLSGFLFKSTSTTTAKS